MAYIGRENDGFGVRSRFIYTATGGQTTFNTDDSGNALSYSDGAYVDVYLNGVLLDPADYTATSLTSIVLDSGATASDILEVIVYDVFSVFSGTFTNGITANTVTVTGDLTVDTSTLKVDSTNNRVGILEASPTVPLEVKGAQGYASSASNLSTSTTKASAKIRGSSDASTSLFFGSLTNDAEQYIQSCNGAGTAADDLALNPFGGTVLVGKVTPDFDGGVFEAGPGGTFVSRSGTPFGVNRNSSEGAIQNFYKDGTQVGEIGVIATNNIYITNPVDGLGLGIGDDNLYPVNGSGGANGDSVDLGDSTVKFNNIYAVNGTIQTSDQNKKQQIASLTDAEINAAKAISKLFKTFKFNDSVEAKGDNARTHAGVIAQEVRTALEAEGLDATKYAFFCSDTWWETNTEVPAVEAKEAVYDDDGNLVSEAIEVIDAVKAHTQREIYKTADKAPEGATQKTLLGIRYPELLAFIGAATEQRLTSIEARLTALENA